MLLAPSALFKHEISISSLNGLARKPIAPDASACARAFISRKSGNENDREVMTLCNQFALQLYPIHARHLHVANQALGVIQPVRFQERFSGCKLEHCIPKRSNEAGGRVPKRIVVIDDCDHRHRPLSFPRK